MLEQSNRSKSSGRSDGLSELSQQQRALQQAMHDRRSQSRPNVRSEQPQQQQQNGGSSGDKQRHQRPRPISTGRTLRPSQSLDADQDPASVTRAILDLREKREQAHRHRESFKQQQTHSRSSSGTHDVTPPSPQQVASDNRLKHAEDKISNLMQELEELRFFHEIDITSPSPTNTLTPLPQSSPVAAQSRPVAQQAPPPPPPSRRNGPAPSKTPQQMQRSSTIPQQPRNSPQPLPASSPLRRSAPAVSTEGSARPALSPRRIASLDRTTLELETQELQRRVDILEREKSSLNATIELCEQELVGKEDDVRRIHILEGALADLRNELSKQLQEMRHGKAQLSDQYEAKLEQMRKKYETSKQEAEHLSIDLNNMRSDMEELEACYKVKDEQAKLKLQQQVVAADERESMLELQLAEASMQLDTVKETLEDQAQLVTKVEKEVLETTERLKIELKEQHDRFNHKVKELEDQLTASQLVADRLKVDHQSCLELLQNREEELATVTACNSAQTTRLLEFENHLESLSEQHTRDVQTLKKTHEERERQRLDNIVQANHAASKELENRMNDLQTQLMLANDRHEAEMQAKDDDLNLRLEREIEVARNAVTSEFNLQLSQLQEELQVMTTQYEQTKEESLRVLVQAESKDRDLAREWERKDAMRQSEMDRMNDKLDKAMRDLSDRDSKVQGLLDRLVEAENSKKASLLELETQHDDDVKAREELFENQRKVWKVSEAKLRIDLARKESEFLELQESVNHQTDTMKHEMEQLQREIDEKERSRENVDQQLNSKVAHLQACIDKAQQDFVSEQSRHEALESELKVEMAKLEGKLSATESNLKEKRVLIEDLEQKLTQADDVVSAAGSKLHSEIFSLRRDLDASRELLLQERTLAEEKEREISELAQEQRADKVKLERMVELELKLVKLEQDMEEAHREKSVHMDKLNKLRKEQEDAAEKLEETKKKLAVEKEQVSMELMRKQKEIETTIEQFTCTVIDMETKLEDKDREMSVLKANIEQLTSSLNRAEDASTARSMNTKELNDKISELEKSVEQHKQASTKMESEKSQQVIELEKRLSNAKMVQEEIVRQMKVIEGERAEAFDALEQVIQEVHIREDELDSLSTVLERRDNELENAKIIATKALASAQEIKVKYMQKGARVSDRHAELQIQIDELNTSVEFLQDKNVKMQRKTLKLEAELRDRNLECIQLRDVLHGISRQEGPSRAIETDYGPVDQHGFLPLSITESNSPNQIGKMDEFMLMESGFSMTEPDEPSQDSSFMINESMSTNTANLGGATQWLHDFNSDLASNFGESVDGVRSEPGTGGAVPPSIGRDSLRKYVRRRYMKQKGKITNESLSEC